MIAAMHSVSRCFVAAATTKYLSFSAVPTSYVFLKTLKVFTTDRWDLYAVVQSTLHEVWARKYSGALKQDLRYSRKGRSSFSSRKKSGTPNPRELSARTAGRRWCTQYWIDAPLSRFPSDFSGPRSAASGHAGATRS